nr:hybrid sensor histidine kinase/response regulator [uncultured Rhodopila sp.]
MNSSRVLLVEDERIVVLNLRRQLAKLGYTVAAVAASGDEALRQIEAQRPDVVLMDIRIEGPTDGIETTARISPDLLVPVIYLTAHAEDATLERARATKPSGFLVKPFSERELHATIQMALAGRAVDMMARENEQRLDQLVAARTAELHVQIERRQKAEETLERAHRLKAIGQLTGGIAHDFNNLLTVIVGNLSLLEARIDDDGHARLVTAALAAAARGAELTRQLLTFGGRQMVRPEHLNVNDVLMQCGQIVRTAVGPMIGVDFRLQAQRAVCFLDREEILRVMLNLALNARKAMPSGGTLSVETGTVRVEQGADDNLAAGDYIRIAVSDTGHGMTEDVLARAFEPFFTTKALGEGGGLGLSQTYGFARQAGGHATIQSGLGKGTSVILFLPLAVPSSETPETTAVAGAGASPVPPINLDRIAF